MQPKRLALWAKQACEDKKAQDVVILDVRKLANFTHFFVIASGTSDRHVQAITTHVSELLREKKQKAWHLEGLRDGQWALVDYGDVIVHVFLKEKRTFYALERLWGDAVTV